MKASNYIFVFFSLLWLTSCVHQDAERIQFQQSLKRLQNFIDYSEYTYKQTNNIVVYSVGITENNHVWVLTGNHNENCKVVIGHNIIDAKYSLRALTFNLNQLSSLSAGSHVLHILDETNQTISRQYIVRINFFTKEMILIN